MVVTTQRFALGKDSAVRLSASTLLEHAGQGREVRPHSCLVSKETCEVSFILRAVFVPSLSAKSFLLDVFVRWPAALLLSFLNLCCLHSPVFSWTTHIYLHMVGKSSFTLTSVGILFFLGEWTLDSWSFVCHSRTHCDAKPFRRITQELHLGLTFHETLLKMLLLNLWNC